MKKIITLLIIIALVSYLIACGGGNNSSETFGKLSATTSLRLGRSSNSVGPVATSAALSNGEAVVIIFDALTGLISEVLFKNQLDEAIRIVVDPSGRPIFAETKDSKLSFDNFSETSVDVLFESTNKALSSFTFQLLDESIKLLKSDNLLTIVLGLGKDSQNGQRGYLSAALVAARIAGCSGVSASSQFSTSSAFSAFSDSLCGAPLLDEINLIALDENNDLTEVTVTRIPESAICSNINTFNNGQDCILNFGGKLVSAARREIVGVFPTPTPKPKPSTPTPTEKPTEEPTEKPTEEPTTEPTKKPTPPPPPPPIKSPFEGHWEGRITQNFITTFCTDGPVSFDIKTEGDARCGNPKCSLDGNIHDGGSIVSAGGELNKNDDVSFSWINTNTGNIAIDGQADGTLSGNIGTGTFTTTGGCSGTFTVTKQ